jgi:hypothetical protein
MYAQVNRNTRNYKARTSRALQSDLEYTVMARSRFSSVSLGFSIADRAISGERRPHDFSEQISLPLSNSRVDTSPANSRHRDASH